MRALVLSSGVECVASGFSTELLMKFLIRLFVFALVLLLILGLIVAFLPASVALGWMEGRMGGVKLETVSGSVWNGRAEQLTVRERALGAVSWSISPWALLSRRLDADVSVDGPELKAAGFVSIDKPGNLQLRGMQLSLEAQRMQPALDIPALQLRGTVDFDLREVVVVQYFPTRIEGSAVWRDAAVAGAADALLGEIRSEFATQADGSIAGTVTDSGGPLQIEGGRFSAGIRGISAEATLRARNDDAAVLRALQHVGELQPDGSSRLQINGQLKRVGG
jgi:general secretion pathway protein N